MKRKMVMVIAGEASGDANAAELVKALSQTIPSSQFRPSAEAQPRTAPFAPRFFGAGGPKMAEAGVELIFDMTSDSVIGVTDVVKKLPRFLQKFRQLLKLATERQPYLIILVDFAGFNRRFAKAIRNYVRSHQGTFFNWKPKIVQYISPQVWASRPGRANKMAKDIDLLLCLFPFEKQWYAHRVPELAVEFVGHPMFERTVPAFLQAPARSSERRDFVLLLPGSRRGELKRHLPPMLEAARKVEGRHQVRFKMVLPNESLVTLAREYHPDLIPGLELQIGNLPEALQQATIAIASTGTVTLECAHFRVPTVAIYKTSWITYLIGRAIIQVKYLAMPNLLANERLFPELIQHEATAGNIAQQASALLDDSGKREQIRSKLQSMTQSLGGAGASQRAAQAITKLLATPQT